MPTGSRKPPWYRQTEVLDRACAYVAASFALHAMDDEPPQVAQIWSYKFDAVANLIFESNTFESAGLSHAGTRQLLAELGIDRLSRVRPTQPQEARPFGALFDLKGDVDAALRHGGRTRPWREVTQHYVAWFVLMNEASRLGAVLHGLDEEELNRQVIRQVSAETGVPPEKLDGLPPLRFFLSAEFLRDVHRILAEGLMPDDAKVPAGEYRIDHRIAGRATGFVAPELIASAMAAMEAEARSNFSLALTGREAKAYELAAKYSHRITAIHPFPDFNGRLSRLVLSACMEWAGVPFPLSIKFDKKGRERYLYALRRADKGDLRPMTMLVARAVVDGFEDIDAKLELVGLPRLLAR